MKNDRVRGMVTPWGNEGGCARSFSIITDQGKEIEIMDNSVARRLAPYEYRSITAIGKVRKTGEGVTKFWLVDFRPLDFNINQFDFDTVG